MRVIFLFLVFARALFPQEASTPAELANLQGDPSAIAAEYINVITGDFVYKKSDLLVNGAEPLSLDRYYTSRENKEKDSKWEIFQHHTAIHHKPKQWCRDKTKVTAKVDEENGIRIPYCESEEGLVPETWFFNRGIVNKSGYNPKKNRVEYKKGILTVHYSNGTSRRFIQVRNIPENWQYDYSNQAYFEFGQRIFYLDHEKLPNGRYKKYHWKMNKWEPELQSVTTTDPSGEKIFAEAKFSYKGREVKIKSSDKKCLKYIFSRKTDHEKSFLRRIRSSDYPEEWLKRKSHKLIKRILPDGREVSLIYDRKGRVKTIEFPHKVCYSFKYSASRGFTCVTNPDYSQTQYFYNPKTYRLTEIRYLKYMGRRIKTEKFFWSEDGNLIAKEILDEKDEPILRIEYEYDENFNRTCQTTIGQITSESSEDRYSIHYEYDDLHRLLEEKHDDGKTVHYEYLKDTHLPTCQISSRNGIIHRRISYEYNEDHTLISELTDAGDESEIEILKRITPRGSAPFYGLPEWVEIFDRNGLLRKTHLVYDKYGNVEETIVFDAEGDRRFNYLTLYNKKSQLVLTEDPKGKISKYDYDENGNLTLESTPSGVYIERKYDKLNRLRFQIEKAGDEEQITEHVYGVKPNPVRTIDALGGLHQSQYDELGNLTCSTLPNRGQQFIVYNALGHVISTKDPEKHITKIVPNILGDPLKISYPDGTEEAYTYNANGTLATHTDQNHTCTAFIYDDYGNITKEIIHDSNGNLIGEIWRKYNAFHLLEEANLEGHVTSYAYTSSNELESKTYGGCTTNYTYDSLGRLETETIEDYTIWRTYDELDRIIKEEEYSNAELIRIVETKYDVHSNPKEIIRYPNDNPESSYIKYDPFGRPIKKTDPLGEETTISYAMQNGHLFTTTVYPENIVTVEVHDSLEELVHYQKFDPYGQLIEEKKCIYDRRGNLSSQQTGNHTIKYTYDSMNRLASITESEQRTQYSTYTNTGELATLTKPDGTVLAYTYDSFGNLESLRSSKKDIHYTFVHNKLGQLLSSTDHLQNTMTFRKVDPHGNILEETLGNGYKLNFAYDNSGRRSQTTLPSGKTVFYTHKGPLVDALSYDSYSHSFEYDLAFNLSSENTFSGQINRSYDAISRPTGIDSSYLKQSCTYTRRGNIDTITTDDTTKNYRYDSYDHLIEEPEQTYTYDSLHNRTSKNEIHYPINDLNEVDTFEYDQNGNLISDGVNTYTYDSLDRLIQANGEVYTYDAQHRRLTANGTAFIWDHENEIGTPSCYRILRPTGRSECGATVLLILRGSPIIPVCDIQGNLTKVHSADGHLMELHTLTAFGELLSTICQVPWGFASKRHDEETGLVYFGRRFYDPALGRFITPDPAGYTDSQNLYAYALNNPLIFFDPHGLNFASFSDMYIPDLSGPAPSLGSPVSFKDWDSIHMHQKTFNGTKYYEPSHRFDLGRPETPDRRIVYMGGINNDKNAHIDHANYISKMAGGNNINIIYNATHGGCFDALQAQDSLKYVCTNPERELVHDIFDYFSNSSSSATLLIVAHSHAAAIVRNTLHYYPVEEHKKRIFVLAIAPAAYTDPRNCGTVKNFRHPNDIVPTLDKYGAYHFAHTIYDICPVVPNSFACHHSFQDPIYFETLRSEINKYLDRGYIK